MKICTEGFIVPLLNILFTILHDAKVELGYEGDVYTEEGPIQRLLHAFYNCKGDSCSRFPGGGITDGTYRLTMSEDRKKTLLQWLRDNKRDLSVVHYKDAGGIVCATGAREALNRITFYGDTLLRGHNTIIYKHSELTYADLEFDTRGSGEGLEILPFVPTDLILNGTTFCKSADFRGPLPHCFTTTAIRTVASTTTEHWATTDSTTTSAQNTTMQIIASTAVRAYTTVAEYLSDAISGPVTSYNSTSWYESVPNSTSAEFWSATYNGTLAGGGRVEDREQYSTTKLVLTTTAVTVGAFIVSALTVYQCSKWWHRRKESRREQGVVDEQCSIECPYLPGVDCHAYNVIADPVVIDDNTTVPRTLDACGAERATLLPEQGAALCS